jgi:protein-tyrosine phosphatase
MTCSPTPVVNESESRIRIIPLEGGINFRDLGGYSGAGGRRVRWNSVFRSGTIHVLTADDRTRLESLGIRAAIDLRSNWERQELPHGLLGEADVLYWAHDHDRVGGDLMRMLLRDPNAQAAHMHEAMLQLYQELPYHFSEAYRQLFKSVSAGALPLVFNCAAGKDRTGVAAALLLSALGVAWEDVMADYLLTEKVVPDIIRVFGGTRMGGILGRLGPQVSAPLFCVDRAYLDAMRHSIMSRSGSMENYCLSELRLESTVLETMRRRLLD